MAKNPNKSSHESDPAAVEAAAPQLDEAGNPIPAADATAAKEPDKRFKKLMYPDPATGETKEWKRIELIRHFCTPTDGSLNNNAVGLGWTRSQATAKIRELSGDANFRYQIVFQATKGINGVKKAEKKVPAVAAATPTEAPSGEANADSAA